MVNPVPFIIIGASIIGSLFRSKPSGPPPDAQGFGPLQNPTNPTAPWHVRYGEAWGVPPLTGQYSDPSQLNTLRASVNDRLVKTYHLGAGPNDGRDLRWKHGGRVLFDVVDEFSPASERELEATDTTNRRWRFPTGAVVPNSIVIYLDGVATFSTGPEGGDLTTNLTTTVTNKTSAPRTISRSGGGENLKDSTIPGFFLFGSSRHGGLLPVSGVVDGGSMSMKLTLSHEGTVRFKSGYSQHGKTITVPNSDIAYGVLNDGRRYFYVMYQTGFTALFKPESYRLSYTAKTQGVTTQVDPATGHTVAVFTQPIAAGVAVTATYKTSSQDQTEFDYAFRTGENDQKPVTLGGVTDTRNTYPVGLELTQGTARQYATTGEVDDVIIGIESGAQGFRGTLADGDGIAMRRELLMRIKETSAADSDATKKNDPSTGWVDLRDTNTGLDFFRLEDRLTGTVPWFFSAADLLAYAKAGKLDPTAANVLPTAAYTIEVKAKDAANARWETGVVDTSRYFSDLFLAKVTEVRRVALVLPHHSDLTIQFGKDGLGPDDAVEVRFAGRKVQQPTTGATVDSVTGLPTPGTFAYSRNHVWIACDHITDKVAGAGHTFDWSHIDLPSAVIAAAYCARTATLRNGDTEVAAFCDLTLGEGGQRRSLGDQLTRILAGSEVLTYWSGGKWYFVVDRDDDPVTDPNTGSAFIIDEERDMLAGSVSMQMRGTEEIPTELHVTFRDAAKDDAPSSEQILVDDPQPSPRIVQTVDFPGVRRRSQANRVGSILLRQMRRNLRTIRGQGTIGRGLRLLQLRPGNIALFTSARLQITEMKVRVFDIGRTDGLRPGIEIVQHEGSVYSASFQGPNSATEPGLREPLPDVLTVPPPTLKQLVIKRVSWTLTAGGVGGSA